MEPGPDVEFGWRRGEDLDDFDDLIVLPPFEGMPRLDGPGELPPALGRLASPAVLTLPPPGKLADVPFYMPELSRLEDAYTAVRNYQNWLLPQNPGLAPYLSRLVLARHTRLPAVLRGVREPEGDEDWEGERREEATDLAAHWLFDSEKARALMSARDGAEMRRRLCHPPQTLLGAAERGGEEAAGRPAHVHYQQYHKQRWPVLGGRLVVHLTPGDRRVSVSSSFFPIDEELDFTPRLTAEEAEHRALQLASAWVGSAGAAGLFWQLLRPAVLNPDAPWQRPEQALARRLLLALEPAAMGDGPRGLPWPRRDEGRVPDGTGRTRTKEEVLELAGWLDGLELPAWTAQVAPYDEEEPLLVLPFRGDYHLAYRVEVTSPDQTQLWRVYVDAETGSGLGAPHNVALHGTMFASAASILAGAIPSETSLVQNPSRDFMEVKLSSGAEPDWAAANLETTSVAVHAQEMYQHFRDCDVDPDALHGYSYRQGGQDKQQSPGLKAVVGAPAGDLLAVFNHGHNVHPKLLTFQTGILHDDGREVRHPTWDPEFVYHEVAHGLMWLLNRRPFDDLIPDVPFGTALVEGAANYLARSLAAQQDDTDLQLWARAAYRQDVWQDAWALRRENTDAGADLLPAPNLYPYREAQGLLVYHVGMIWARALWDLRTLLGWKRTDRLLLESFQHIPGWLATFEQAAEGMIEAAAMAHVVGLDEAAPPLLARRGIIAGQGVQALAHADGVTVDGHPVTVIVAGADAGVRRCDGDVDHWQAWDELDGGGTLRGVVALAAEGSTFYAAVEYRSSDIAVEAGVYRRAATDVSWAKLGTWPANRTPCSLAVLDGVLYAGTGKGVWVKDGDADWAESTSEGVACRWPALQLALGEQGSSDMLCAAGFEALQSRRLDTEVWAARDVGMQPVVLSVCATGSKVYAGTLKHGIKQWVNGVDHPVSDVPALPGLGEGAVLALAEAGGWLAAGTTGGLFVGHQTGAGAWQWFRLLCLPGCQTVTVVHWTDDHLLAGTPTAGLWCWDKPPAGWPAAGPWPAGRELTDLASLVNKVGEALPVGGQTGPFDLQPGELRLHTFWVQQMVTVPVTALDSASGQPLAVLVQVYQLGRKLHKVSDTAAAPGRHMLPSGFVVVTVENNTAALVQYRLQF